ncbi:sterol desaturase family protein [Streptomyces roseoverticillatus]|uniref:sterol desaturase family protein n=1 Tax=Streptomyces roseoverticillatus TaxID=66429 RepID=UPI001F35700B|nr:sterol desaturase family protein [Streptomyces roseoverticillatus]MCF3102206.1 sterol desaturase family protein [Streptomyces roseoverticillatus]
MSEFPGISGVDPVDRAAFRRSSPPLVRWRSLDRLTRQHPSGPLVVFTSFITLLLPAGLTASGTVTGVALVFVGYAAWTLTEYWVHRGLFHWEAAWKAAPGAAMARLRRTLHGHRHDPPDDRRRLVVPLAVTMPMALILSGLSRLALGAHWMAFMAGYVLGYLLYDMIHYHVHHHRPRSRAGRALRRWHMLHHFADGSRRFGVSAPWWDLVFGTAGGRRPVSSRSGPGPGLPPSDSCGKPYPAGPAVGSGPTP